MELQEGFARFAPGSVSLPTPMLGRLTAFYTEYLAAALADDAEIFIVGHADPGEPLGDYDNLHKLS